MQAETLIARITFSFAASVVKMPAGAYFVAPTPQGLLSAENKETGKREVLVGFSSASDANRASAGLHLGFACAASGWALTQGVGGEDAGGGLPVTPTGQGFDFGG